MIVSQQEEVEKYKIMTTYDGRVAVKRAVGDEQGWRYSDAMSKTCLTAED